MKTYRIEVHPAGVAAGLAEPVKQGTAWAISGDIVVTAFHVVADEARQRWLSDEGNATYWLTDDEEKIEVEPAACDRVGDVALLRRKSIVGESEPKPWKSLPICEWGVGLGAVWDAAGFAVIAGGQHLTLHGTVKSFTPDASGTAIELYVEERVEVDWKGASGSPVCVEASVVGILTREIGGAATLRAAEVESALRLLRIYTADEICGSCEDVVQDGCSSMESLHAIQEKLDMAPWPEKDDLEELARATVARAALFGAEGLLALLAALGSDDDMDVESLRSEIGLCALLPERKLWPKRLLSTRFDDEHGRYAPPEDLLGTWKDFIERKRWDERVGKRLQEAASALKSLNAPRTLVRELEGFDTSRNYSTMRGDLAQLLKHTATHDAVGPDMAEPEGIDKEAFQDAKDNYHRAIGALRHLARPRTPFGRCFFLMGSNGSGKTHFLGFVFREDAASHHDPLVLPVSLPDTQQIPEDFLEKAIAKALRQATGRSFQNLGEFQTTLDYAMSSRLAYLSRAKLTIEDADEIPRLVIAIDDLQRAMASDPDANRLCEILEESIKHHTICPSVHWLLGLRDTSYSRLKTPLDPPSFWDEYGCASSFGETPGQREDEVPAKGGWIDLDRINDESDVGLHILQDKLGRDCLHEALNRAEEHGEGRGTGLLRFLNQPWFAWTLAKMSDTECKRAISTGDLRYIMLAEEVRNVQLSAFDPSPRERERTNYYVRALAATFLHSDGRRIRDGKLAEDVSQAAFSAKFQFDGAELSKYVDRLIDVNLLRPMQGPPPYLEIDFEMLWSYEGAQHLYGALAGLSGNDAAKRLESVLGDEVEGIGLKEGALEFLLMLMDRAQSPRALEELVKCVLSSKRLPAAAIWFAGAKVSPEFQRFLCDIVNDLRKKDCWKLADKRRLLFAWLTFVEHASAAALEAKQRIALLRSDCESIYQNGLSTYYFAVAARILEDAPDVETLRACMLALRGCERAQAGLAEHLADRAVSRLIDMSDDPISEIFQYLKDGFKAAVREHESCKTDAAGRGTQESKPKRWHREFFREWVLHEFCKSVVYDEGPMNAFSSLAEHGWFDKNRFKWPIGLEMEREANIAIGSYFHHRHDLLNPPKGVGVPFLELIRDLTESDKYENRVIASHLIRHTRPTFGEHAVQVDPVFHPYLVALARDPQLLAERSFRAFYEANLGALTEP